MMACSLCQHLTTLGRYMILHQQLSAIPFGHQVSLITQPKVPSVVSIILVSITFSTDLMKPCCFHGESLFALIKYFLFRTLKELIIIELDRMRNLHLHNNFDTLKVWLPACSISFLLWQPPVVSTTKKITWLNVYESLILWLQTYGQPNQQIDAHTGSPRYAPLLCSFSIVDPHPVRRYLLSCNFSWLTTVRSKMHCGHHLHWLLQAYPLIYVN